MCKNLFKRHVTPQVKIPQCCKQAGTKDCGVYAIAFATTIAFGKNPGRQNLKQDETRAYLVVCFNKHSVSIFPCK